MRGGDLFEQRRHRRLVLADGAGEGARAPEKDPPVPRVIAGGDKLLGVRAVRLLGKALDAAGRNSAAGGLVEGCAEFDVAVAGLRARRRNSQHDDALTAGGQLDAGANDLGEAGQIADDVVRGKDADDGVGCGGLEQKRSQRARWRGVACGRLAEDVGSRDLRQLTSDRLVEQRVGDDPDVVCRGERQQTVEGLLDHGAVPVKGEHLLGTSLAAARPEACTAAAGQDHRRERGERERERERESVCVCVCVCELKRVVFSFPSIPRSLAQFPQILAHANDALVDHIARDGVAEANVLTGAEGLAGDGDHMRFS